MSVIDTSNLLSQSPYLDLQAAGSDGSDQTSPGVHLRWGFSGRLGDLHLPKGNLAASGQPYYTTAGFNKADDYVKVYRRAYDSTFPVTVDFSAKAPDQILKNSAQREWHYENIVPVAAVTSNTRTLIIRFTNFYKYDLALQQADPSTDTIGFLKAYDDIIEAEVDGCLCFSAQVTMDILDEQQPAVTRMETISLSDNSSDANMYISCRKKFHPDDESYLLKEDGGYLLKEDTGYLVLEEGGLSHDKDVVAENIKYIRFKGDNSYPVLVKLQTYEDYITGINNDATGWTDLGSFSLSLDDSEVYQRLENPPYYTIDNAWPKFNDGATVNADNYKSRWIPVGNDPGPGLKYSLELYLQLSMAADNLEAYNTGPDSDTIPNLTIGPWVIGQADSESGNFASFSLLAMLGMVTFDFHAARMMGMGHIDNDGLDTDPAKNTFMQRFTIQKLPSRKVKPLPPLHTAISRFLLEKPITGCPRFR